MTVKSWLVQNPSFQHPRTAPLPTLNLGTSIGAFFDVTKDREILETYGPEAYKDYERSKRNILLTPGRAFPLIVKLLNYNMILDHNKPQNPIVTLSFFGPLSSEMKYRVINTLRHYDLLEPHKKEELRTVKLFLDLDAAKRETVQTRQIKLFFSTKYTEVKALISRKCPAIHVSGGEALPSQHTTIDNKVSISFDLDRVLLLALGTPGKPDFWVENEQYTQWCGLDAARQREYALRNTPAHAGPIAPFLKRAIALRNFLRNSGTGFDLALNVVTARNDYHIARMQTSLQKLSFVPDASVTLGPSPKGPHVRDMESDLFIDDGPHHVSNARAIAPRALTGLVPWAWEVVEETTKLHMPEWLKKDKPTPSPPFLRTITQQYNRPLPPMAFT